MSYFAYPGIPTEKTVMEAVIERVLYLQKKDLQYVRQKTRKRRVVELRQICMYFANKRTTDSLTRIGKYLGNLHHATVIHGIKHVEELMQYDKQFEERINYIEENL